MLNSARKWPISLLNGTSALLPEAQALENGAEIALVAFMSAGGGSEIAVILLDENGCIVDAHASCMETFGWHRDELLGKDIRELLQYGRDLLMSQLRLLEDDESSGNTSFTVRVLAKHKDQHQFPARATVRRFQELECWTVAFYSADVDQADSNVAPSVSAQEISLAKRALEEGTAIGREANKTKKAKVADEKGEGMSVSRLWRNSRLLFSSREEKGREVEETPASNGPDDPAIAETVSALVAQCETAVTPREENSPASEPVKPAIQPVLIAPGPQPVTAPRIVETPSSAAPATRAEAFVSPSRVETHSQPVESVAGLARLKAELEKERGERARIEQRAASLSAQVQTLHLQLSEGLNLERENQTRIAGLEQELREAQEALSRSKSELESERFEHRSAEEELEIVRALNIRLEENIGTFENSRKTFQGTQTELQARLEQLQSSLRESEMGLDKEREARLRLEQLLTTAQRDARTLEQKTAVETARLRSSLEEAQFENHRVQEDVLRSQADALDVARDARGRLGRFRQNFSQVLEHINGTTRELLQSPLSEEQKCVLEALLHDVIALEASLEKECQPPANSGE